MHYFILLLVRKRRPNQVFNHQKKVLAIKYIEKRFKNDVIQIYIREYFGNLNVSSIFSMTHCQKFIKKEV